MWLRRAGAAEPGAAAACPFVIVIEPCPALFGDNKRPSPPGEGPVGCGGWSLLAPVPPCPFVLPPGAGNEEADEAVKTDEERAKKTEERYVLETRVVHGQLNAPAVSRDDD